MHDLHFIRTKKEEFDKLIATRIKNFSASEILKADTANREAITKLNAFQAKRNFLAKQIGQAKANGKEQEATKLINNAEDLRNEMKEQEELQASLQKILNDLLIEIPNAPDEEVPVGKDEKDNKVVKEFLTSKRKLSESNEYKEHFDVKSSKNLFDFALASKVSGARFSYLFGEIAKLERALGNFMLDTHKSFGFTEVVTPVLVNSQAVYNTGQLPKFSQDLFKTTDGRWLIPTAEVTLTNIVANKTLHENELPLRFCALSQCFRSEAGSAGKDTHGLIRQHQFAKVELVTICSAEKSAYEHENMLNAAENILNLLELPFRRVLLCTGDMGFCAAKTYDLEVWLPGQQQYREISSISNCHSFQARRMDAKYQDENKKRTFVHTLNGSGLAIGRTLIAVIENYQQSDGSILIPCVLRKYLENIEKIF